jgi:hypothetical protein
LSKSATADLDAQARNPYSLSWLWIPGSLAEPVIGPAKGRTRWLAPRNDGAPYPASPVPPYSHARSP